MLIAFLFFFDTIVIMSLKISSPDNKRLLGIDLFRGIAAYGVVLIHGLGEISRTENAGLISNYFVSFCVPFSW